MSYARMSRKQKILAEELSALLAEAEQIDHDEDAEFGRDNKVYGLPADLAHESRMAKVTEAKAALKTEAKERAEAEAGERAMVAGKDEDKVFDLRDVDYRPREAPCEDGLKRGLFCSK
jgi:hypothetical protein